MAYFFDFPPVLRETARVREQWQKGKLVPNSEVEEFIAKGGDNPAQARMFWDNYNEGIKIAKRFNKPVNYVRPLIAAILSSEVTNSDYRTIFIEDPTHHYLPNDLLIENRIAYVTNRVRPIDLKEINTQDTKSIGNIQKRREWFLYFAYEHMGYKKIAKETSEKETTIISAIKSYLKHMSDSFALQDRIDAFKEFGFDFNTNNPLGI